MTRGYLKWPGNVKMFEKRLESRIYEYSYNLFYHSF